MIDQRLIAVDPVTGSPVAGARATVLGPGGTDILTDESGRFELWASAPPHDTLTVVFEKQSGSEALSAVRTLPMSPTGQWHELGVVTLGGACEPAWSAGLFPAPAQLNSYIVAMTIFDDGSGGGPELYAGGDFTAAGIVQANRIAKWNGSTWSALGTGMNAEVRALAVFDDGSGGGPALYAGGFFTTAGGVSANRIAKWNGNSWSAVAPEVEVLNDQHYCKISNCREYRILPKYCSTDRFS